ncbi:MAG: family 10 glycosylhydrolase [Saprospiraceae bacterium]|nr:family 10 glycosylhydrolase [Saprospiraceae bacterium]
MIGISKGVSFVYLESERFLLSPQQQHTATIEPIVLTRDHIQAVNRNRNLVVQYDAFNELGTDFDQWLSKKFQYIDNPGNQVDAIWWDIGGANTAPFPELVGDRYEHPEIKKWWDQGIDWIGELIKETRSRDLEVFWNFRMAEVELKKHENPIKTEHPDWLIKSWYYPGLWNYAIPEVRQNRLQYLSALMQKYPFDGVQLDFARHVPILPVGAQWENREHVTEFVRMVRFMLLEMERKMGRPFLLSVKLPRTLEGCRMDGFDVETWSKEKLIDIIVMGSRSMHVDIQSYKEISRNRNIKLIPCWDEHHTTDGYQSAAPEFLRGVFANWWQQGADGVMVFNWNVDHESEYDIKRYEALGTEMGNPETLRLKDKVFAIERRGGYPWAEGYFGRNDDAPLPFTLANDGSPGIFELKISEHLSSIGDHINYLKLHTTIFGAKKGDQIGARLNGTELNEIKEDFEWKDSQIFSPLPQPNSGSALPYGLPEDPNQKLLLLQFEVKANSTKLGSNQLEIYIKHREPYGHGSNLHNIVIEKLDLHLDYQ